MKVPSFCSSSAKGHLVPRSNPTSHRRQEYTARVAMTTGLLGIRLGAGL